MIHCYFSLFWLLSLRTSRRVFASRRFHSQGSPPALRMKGAEEKPAGQAQHCAAKHVITHETAADVKAQTHVMRMIYRLFVL